MDDKTKLAIATQASNSVFERLSQFGISIIDTNDHDDPIKGKWKIFSGTLVELGNRLLIATASHCISRHHHQHAIGLSVTSLALGAMECQE